MTIWHWVFVATSNCLVGFVCWTLGECTGYIRGYDGCRRKAEKGEPL
jgi:hypothetical protein